MRWILAVNSSDRAIADSRVCYARTTKRIFRPSIDEVMKELYKIDEIRIIAALPDLLLECRWHNVAVALARPVVCPVR
jgi:hypothetical protein